MNKTVKTKLENEFGIFNIHNEKSCSGDYWLEFEFQIPSEDGDSRTGSVMVRNKESIRGALQRVLTVKETEDDGYHD